jgi:hypothetical protein
LVVDHRVVNADGTADWDHCIDDPLNSRRKNILFSEMGNEVLRFRIDIQPSGACLLSTPVDAAVQFDSLTAALASARVTAADAEADIDIWMDGLYMFVHQPQGWPRRITH